MSGVRVLHVLPHAGAGGQSYLDVLARLDGFESEIFELSASRSPAGAAMSIAGRQPQLFRAARRAHLIHAHGEVASLLCMPIIAARPSVVTLHGLHLLRRLAPGAPARLGRFGLAAIVAAADRTICVSQAERDDLAWLPRRLLERLVVIRNGLALPPPTDSARRGLARAALGLDEDAVAVLYLGQLEARKDPFTLARAVARAHERDRRIRLLVAGDGACASDLRAGAGPELELLGQRRDVESLLAAADMFVMPSLREGLSYAVLEALAHGVPTIVSDAPGNPEAVADAGLVFPVGDEVRLSALIAALAADPGRRAALAAAGRARIAGELGDEQMRLRTRAAYQSVLTAPGRELAAAPA